MATLTSTTALRMNALVALAAVVAAAALMSLALTQPETVAAAIARHDYSMMAAAIGRELAGWLRALLRYV